ncbi:transporter [Lithospermum erythrorhizon]|uniref:Transporter n=1 Tax=Lithospermum erythrorhizon TaxID=34254 RepID=A0AAV3P1X2_LITER
MGFLRNMMMGIMGSKTNKQPRLGGFRAALFVYVMAGLENMSFIAIGVSIYTYFFGYMNFSLTKSANTLTNFMGTAYLLSLFGGFVSDTYLSRFKTSVLFGLLEVLGYCLLTAQAHFEQLRPTPCKDITSNILGLCEKSTKSQEALLFAGLYLVAFGISGTKAATPALGADQFDEKDPKEAAKLPTYFNFLIFAMTFGAIIGTTLLVWINQNEGWDLAFGICTISLFAGILILIAGRSVYRHNVLQGSPLVRIMRVLVVAVRNRNLPRPQKTEDFHEIHDEEANNKHGEILPKSDQLKFLDRAAIVRPTTQHTGPWRLCTVTQVEETKIIVRMLPIILSTIFMNTCLAQLQTFSVQQSTTLDPYIGSFKVPSPSLPIIPFLAMFLLLPLYEYVFVPVVRKFTGIPTGIRQLQRIGIGLVLSAISMAVAGAVETRRLRVARENNMIDSPNYLPMSVFWLGYQYTIFGVADMFMLVGMLDFFYAESSAGMKSLGTAISWCSFAFGYYISTVVVNIVNKVSGGWFVSNNLNRDKLNYFYYLLAGLSVLNFGVYLLCASWYKYKVVEVKKVDGIQENGQSGNTEKSSDSIGIEGK